MAARPCTSPWDDAREAFAVARWQAGDSALTIAQKMGSPFTKNSVIGRIHRLGQAARAPPLRIIVARTPRPPKPAKVAKPKPAPKPVRVLNAAVEPGEKPVAVVFIAPPEPVKPTHNDIARVTFADLQPHQCRWPVGEVNHPEFGFCGEGRIEGKPYCPGHEKRAHVPLKPHQPKTANDLARSLRRWAA